MDGHPDDARVIRVTWRARAWTLASHIPLTGPWRHYRRTVAWLDESQTTLTAIVPDAPPWPAPAPRNPDVLEYAVGCMTAMLHSARAVANGATGPEAAAVAREHRPPQPRIEAPS